MSQWSDYLLALLKDLVDSRDAHRYRPDTPNHPQDPDFDLENPGPARGPPAKVGDLGLSGVIGYHLYYVAMRIV